MFPFGGLAHIISPETAIASRIPWKVLVAAAAWDYALGLFVADLPAAVSCLATVAEGPVSGIAPLVTWRKAAIQILTLSVLPTGKGKQNVSLFQLPQLNMSTLRITSSCNYIAHTFQTLN